jgi:hypothetical protein
LNGGQGGQTAGDFANYWIGKFGGSAPTGALPPMAGAAPLSFGPIGEGPGASALGNIAADFMTKQRDEQAARAEADAARRTALFSPTGPAAPQGLASLYG